MLATVNAGISVSETENDSSLSRRDKDKLNGGSVGSAIGSVAGGTLGFALGGPIGGIIGAYLGEKGGEIIGKKVGEWVNDLRTADIPGTLSSTWIATNSTIGSVWNATTAAFTSAWNATSSMLAATWTATTSALGTAWNATISTISPMWDATTAAIKSTWNATIGPTWDATTKKIESAWDATIGPAWDKAMTKLSDLWASGKKVVSDTVVKVVDTTKQVAQSAVETAKESGSWVAEKTKYAGGWLADKAGSTWDATKNGVSSAIGSVSKLFESGKSDAGTVSTGKGDAGGASYGTYQLSSKTGTVQRFLKSSPYEAQFSGLTPGSAAFNDKWKETAKNDQNFGQAQHDFIDKTHYQPQLQNLQRSGIDVSNLSKAKQEAIWSTSVQFGGNTDLIKNALSKTGKDANSLTDSEFVSAVQDYKIANNDRLFSKSSEAVRASTLKRAGDEKQVLLSRYAQPQSAVKSQNGAQIQPSVTQTVASKPEISALKLSASPEYQAFEEKTIAAAGGKAVASSDIRADFLKQNPDFLAKHPEMAKPAAPAVGAAQSAVATNAAPTPASQTVATNAPASPVPYAPPTAATVTVSAPMPVARFSPPPIPKIEPAPPIDVPLASSGGTGGRVTVAVPQQEFGQDLSDRRIAHIVTGGLSGGYV
ncbi:hypothetical protein CCP3SC15_100025 [Gammaproteobacteria bacterium]